METQKEFFITKRTSTTEGGKTNTQWWAYVLSPNSDAYIALFSSSHSCPIEAFENTLARELEKYLKKPIGDFKPSYILF